MKRAVFTFLVLLFVSFQGIAQKLDLNLGFGSYRVPNQIKYELPRAGFNLNFGLIYQLNDHWEMGTAINHSVFTYDRASLAGTLASFGSSANEGRVNSDHLYFIFRRKINLPFELEAIIGLGIGGYIENNEYYFPVGFDKGRNLYSGVALNKDIETGAHFPMTYALRKVFANKVHVGLEGGFFFDQNLNTRGVFIGPKAGIFL